MVLTSPGVLMEERIPQNGCCQCLYPQDEPQLPHTSLGGFLGSASRSDSSSFQIPVSALDLEVCEILCALFESKVTVSFKAKCSGALLPSAGAAGWETAQLHYSLQRTSAL